MTKQHKKQNQKKATKKLTKLKASVVKVMKNVFCPCTQCAQNEEKQQQQVRLPHVKKIAFKNQKSVKHHFSISI